MPKIEIVNVVATADLEQPVELVEISKLEDIIDLSRYYLFEF